MGVAQLDRHPVGPSAVTQGPWGIYQSQGLRPLSELRPPASNQSPHLLELMCGKSGPAQYECPCLETPRSESRGAALLVGVAIVSEKRSPPLHPGPSSYLFIFNIFLLLYF